MKRIFFSHNADVVNYFKNNCDMNREVWETQIRDLCMQGIYGSASFFSTFEKYFFSQSEQGTQACWFLWDEEVVGVLLGRIILDEAEVLHVVVAEKMRAQGLGSQLFFQFEKTLKDKNVKKIFLEVGENNSGALRLYDKIGFSKIATRKKYYKGIEDAFVMEKIL